jgi:hypothetical protein
MFEQFDEDSRRVVVLAQEEARGLGHSAIGTEHLLLALARLGGSVTELLAVQGVTYDGARALVVEILGPPTRPAAGSMPFTDASKAVLEGGLRVSGDRDDTQVTPAHLLLAVLDASVGTADQVLARLVGDREVLRRAALAILHGGPDAAGDDRAARAELRSAEFRAVAGAPFPGFGPPGGNVPRCALCGRPDEPEEWSVVARGTIVCAECLRQALTTVDEAARTGDPPVRLRFTRAGSQPPEPDAARAGIDRCFAAVFPGRPVGDRRDRTWAVEPGDGVADDLAVMQAGAANAPMTVVDITVERVGFLDPEHAEVTIGVWMAGNPSPMLLPGRAVVVDGTWRVSRDTLAWFANQAQQFRRPPGRPWG